MDKAIDNNTDSSTIQSSERDINLDYDRTAPIEVELEPSAGTRTRFTQALPVAGDFPKKKQGSCAACKAHPQKLPLCKYCSCDATFVHDGFDPIYRKGIWQKHKLDNVCVKKMSIDEQNNKGKWMLCDVSCMDNCHFYEPGN